MNDQKKLPKAVLRRDRNVIAAALSVIPGLGHIYKGSFAVGFILMLVVAPLSVWVGVLLSLATLGVGLFVPVLLWGLVGFHAYFVVDHRKHHVMEVL